MIGLIWVTEAGRQSAERLAEAWPGRCTVHSGPVKEQVEAAWGASEAIIAFLATGATVRLIAPLLQGKETDPGVVCVDEGGTFAVALLGGHGGGANDLARTTAEVLGAQPVITTGTDAVGLSGLDTLGFAVRNPENVAKVTKAILDGEPVHWTAEATWPIPALPANVGDYPHAAHHIHVTDRAMDGNALVLHPPSLVLGIGGSRGVTEAEIADLVAGVLTRHGLAEQSVRAVATADIKADEPGIVAFAANRGLPLLTFSAAELAAVNVPNPSEVVRAAVGTPSVAEAAALLAAAEPPGRTATQAPSAPPAQTPHTPPAETATAETAGGKPEPVGGKAKLVVHKTASAMATVAVARSKPRGRLAIIGLGPGASDLRTPRATSELRAASIVVGLDQYVSQIKHLLRPGTRIVESGLGAEEERARAAVELAQQGHAVALIGSGDAGIYAMASPALEFAGHDIEVVTVPGVTAALAASALLGAPLGHDHVYVSLSDLHTPWEVIERRIQAAAEADLVLCLYNPRSARRRSQLPTAISILSQHRPPETPVGYVREAARSGQRVEVTTLAKFDPDEVDMNTVVIIGARTTRVKAGRMVTPRGYQWMPE